MGFLNGSVTFERYRVTEDPTDAFGEDHIEILKKFSINQSFGNLHEEPAIGFSAGSHLLDTQFSYEKNIIGDAMHFGVRIDACKIPGPMKRAWMAMELADQLIENPGNVRRELSERKQKRPSRRVVLPKQKKETFIRQDMTSVLWDGITGTMYLGSTSEKVNDQCLGLLNRAFGLEFNKVTSGSLALEIADEAERLEEIYASNPTAFHPEGSDTITWWSGMKDDYSYLGNEFLLWLWWTWEKNSTVVDLPDGTELSGMFARSLILDCPVGENGKETISADSPVALPESNLAIGMGKLPRKAGLTVVREGTQYEFVLNAETFSIGSAKIKQIDNAEFGRNAADRIESIRQLSETVDQLYGTFCDKRMGKAWAAESKKILSWLQDSRPDSGRKAA